MNYLLMQPQELLQLLWNIPAEMIGKDVGTNFWCSFGINLQELTPQESDTLFV